MSYAYVNYIGERSESCVIASKQPHNNALATCSEKVCNIRRKRIQKENGTHAKSKKENGVHRHLQPKHFPHKLNLQVNTGGWENGRGGGGAACVGECGGRVLLQLLPGRPRRLSRAKVFTIKVAGY